MAFASVKGRPLEPSNLLQDDVIMSRRALLTGAALAGTGVVVVGSLWHDCAAPQPQLLRITDLIDLRGMGNRRPSRCSEAPPRSFQVETAEPSDTTAAISAPHFASTVETTSRWRSRMRLATAQPCTGTGSLSRRKWTVGHINSSGLAPHGAPCCPSASLRRPFSITHSP